MKREILSIVAAALLCVSCIGTTTSTVAVESVAITNPAAAIEALKAGNERFVKGESIHPNSDAARREQTLSSQSPFAVIISCSDSRVPVELLFDQGIGDLFVIRTAGNTITDDSVMGSVDYAVDHLGTPLVVVLGHQHCGGVTAAISTSDDEHDHEHHHNGKIGELIELLQRDVKPYIGHPELVNEAIAANTQAQVDKVKQVDYIREQIASGEVQVVGAYYNLDSGVVEFVQ